MSKKLTGDDQRVQTGLRIPKAMHDRVLEISQVTGLSANAIMTSAISDGISFGKNLLPLKTIIQVFEKARSHG